MRNELLNYISHHLDGEISLERLAQLTGYSPYHLHRKASEELREPLGAFIKRQRIDTAAYLLALTALPVGEIKALVGYENDSAFSKAFTSVMGCSPLYYRKQNCFKAQLDRSPHVSLNAEVQRLPTQKALMFPHLGDYFAHQTHQRMWHQVHEFLEKHSLHAQDFDAYTVLYVCQNVCQSTYNRIDAALVPKGEFNWANHKFMTGTLAGGKFLRYRLHCRVDEYEPNTVQVAKHLVQQSYRHREGISVFRFAQAPTYAQPAQAYPFDWMLPIA